MRSKSSFETPCPPRLALAVWGHLVQVRDGTGDAKTWPWEGGIHPQPELPRLADAWPELFSRDSLSSHGHQRKLAHCRSLPPRGRARCVEGRSRRVASSSREISLGDLRIAFSGGSRARSYRVPSRRRCGCREELARTRDDEDASKTDSRLRESESPGLGRAILAILAITTALPRPRHAQTISNFQVPGRPSSQHHGSAGARQHIISQ